MRKLRILDVGQCSFDHGSISRHLGKVYDAEVTRADAGIEAMAAVRKGGFDLVLVNRLFDADGASGVEWIRSLKADPATAHVPVMLVSNYPDAQAEAVREGALIGFGKADLRNASKIAAIDAALTQASN
jgi:response regulator RpfG family c-di-GMP phosphodiesterase